jgi:hypothetical protein
MSSIQLKDRDVIFNTKSKNDSTISNGYAGINIDKVSDALNNNRGSITDSGVVGGDVRYDNGKYHASTAVRVSTEPKAQPYGKYSVGVGVGDNSNIKFSKDSDNNKYISIGYDSNGNTIMYTHITDGYGNTNNSVNGKYNITKNLDISGRVSRSKYSNGDKYTSLNAGLHYRF